MIRRMGITAPKDNLIGQLNWFVRLRWIAGLCVVAASWIDIAWLGWFARSQRFLVIGACILAYNCLLWWLLHGLRDVARRRQFLLLISWVQVLLDLACLTLLVTWTGGIDSPLVTFYVFHMVFASLLLPRPMAYAGAGSAVMMGSAGLWLTDQRPRTLRESLFAAGLVITLSLTVHLANHITSGLRRQHRRLIRQNRKIKSMSRKLHKQQRALIQHEKMVAMGQMAAGVTHEIANPLASMDSLLQLIQRRPERMKPENVATLREQVERINQIIQQMKAFAHPAEVDRQTLPLNEVVEQAIAMVRYDHRIRRVTVDRQLSPNVGSMSLLPQALQQVLINLIINALDAMSDTSDPRLTIRTDRTEGACMVYVSDNGHGIAPQHLISLFEPFFTTKPVGKGTGLGLSISYALIQKMSGSISVKSEPGKGATFSLRLPTVVNLPTAGASRQREGSSPPIAISEKTTLPEADFRA